jgi:hypothetical protein
MTLEGLDEPVRPDTSRSVGTPRYSPFFKAEARALAAIGRDA